MTAQNDQDQSRRERRLDQPHHLPRPNHPAIRGRSQLHCFERDRHIKWANKYRSLGRSRLLFLSLYSSPDGGILQGYAIAAGGLSAITATLFAIDICFPFSSRLWLLGILIWQWVLTLAWTGVVGAFRGRYFDGPTATITAAAGFNLANMLLWLFGSVFGSLSMCLSRRRLNRQKPDESIAMPNYS